MVSWAEGEIEPLTAAAWRGGVPAGRARQKPPPSTPCCELEQNSGAAKGLVLADFKEEAAFKFSSTAPPPICLKVRGRDYPWSVTFPGFLSA